MPQLIRLELARLRQVQELAEIEKSKEAEAEPIALEIEQLEAKVSATGDAWTALMDRATEAETEIRSIDEQIAALTARANGLRESVAEIDRGLAANDREKAVTAQALEAARERFAEVRTTSTGRSIERAITKIERQQKTIVDRNPGAKFFRLEMAIDAEAERLGFYNLVRTVTAYIKTPQFSAAISSQYREARARLKADPSEFEVQQMAIDILREKSIATEHVDVIAERKNGGVFIKTRGITDEARGFCVAQIMRHKVAMERATGDPGSVDASVAA